MSHNIISDAEAVAYVQGPFTMEVSFDVNGTVLSIDPGNASIVLRVELEDQLPDICTLCGEELASRDVVSRGTEVYATVRDANDICLTTILPNTELQADSQVSFNVDLQLIYYIDGGIVALDKINVSKFNRWIYSTQE